MCSKTPRFGFTLDASHPMKADINLISAKKGSASVFTLSELRSEMKAALHLIRKAGDISRSQYIKKLGILMYNKS
jgi:hypothetical protein